MITESFRDKLRKVLAIAQSGQAGEREAAQNLLRNLLRENGLTVEDLDDDAAEIHFFKTGRSADMKELLAQIYFMVTDTHDASTWTNKRYPGCIGFKVTKLQAADIETYYSVLAPAMKREMQRYRRNMREAFYLKNGLFAASPNPEAREFTQEELEHMRQIWALQNAVEKVDFRRQIEQ